MTVSLRKLSLGLALVAPLALAGDSDWQVPATWPTLSLKVGQEGTLENVKVKFIRIIDDSRCPDDPAVECYWHGAVVAQVEVDGPEKAGPVYVGLEWAKKPFPIHLDPQFDPAKKNDMLQHLQLGGRPLGKNSTLWAIRLEPRRKSTAPLESSTYVLTLALERR